MHGVITQKLISFFLFPEKGSMHDVITKLTNNLSNDQFDRNNIN